MNVFILYTTSIIFFSVFMTDVKGNSEQNLLSDESNSNDESNLEHKDNSQDYDISVRSINDNVNSKALELEGLHKIKRELDEISKLFLENFIDSSSSTIKCERSVENKNIEKTTVGSATKNYDDSKRCAAKCFNECSAGCCNTQCCCSSQPPASASCCNPPQCCNSCYLGDKSLQPISTNTEYSLTDGSSGENNFELEHRSINSNKADDNENLLKKLSDTSNSLKTPSREKRNPLTLRLIPGEMFEQSAYIPKPQINHDSKRFDDNLLSHSNGIITNNLDRLAGYGIGSRNIDFSQRRKRLGSRKVGREKRLLQQQSLMEEADNSNRFLKNANLMLPLLRSNVLTNNIDDPNFRQRRQGDGVQFEELIRRKRGLFVNKK